MSEPQPEFSKVRGALWPIHNHELKKFLPMAAIMFCVLFVYTVLRNLKDALIVPAPNSGAEALHYIKFWVVMPAAIGFVVLYAKLSNALSKEKLFYACLLPFIAFYGLFPLVIYPNQHLLHPDPANVALLQQAYPAMKWFLAIYGNWTFVIFYTLAELWGSVVLTLMFWQFANEITRTHEAKRFYSLFGFLANAALMVSGKTVKYCSAMCKEMGEGVDPFQITLDYLMAFVVICGLVMMAIYRWMNVSVLTDPRYYDAAATSGKSKKEKAKLGIGESFKYLLQSKYLGFIAILVLGYGMTINIVEVTWKSQIKLLYPNRNDYSQFMGDFSFWTGVVTMTLIFSTKGVIRRFGWFTGAVVTPLMIMVTGVLFFMFVIFKNDLDWLAVLLGSTPLILAVTIGAIQNILSKGTKYSLFDPTKEMAYIPLDQELKVKGKAAVDVIGGRLGKSGGGLIQQLFLSFPGTTQISIAPALMGVLVIVGGAWLYAVKRLSGEYDKALAEKGDK